MAASASAGIQSGTFGTNLGILGGRLGGSQFGLIAIGVDAGASRLLRSLSAEAVLTGKNLSGTTKALALFNTGVGSMIATVGVAAVAVGGAGLAVAKFDQNLAESAAVLEKDIDQVFSSVGLNAIKLSTQFGRSATEISTGITDLARAGFSLKEIEDSLRGITEFSVATRTSIEDTVELTVKVLRGFNLEAGETDRVLNSLSFALNAAPANANDLLLAFKQLTPVAGQLGISLESAAAAITTMTRTGLGGETGGTSLATGLLNLFTPAENTMEKFGKEIVTFREALKSTGDIALAFDAFLRTEGSNSIEFTKTITELRSKLGPGFTEGSDEELLELAKHFDILDTIVNIFTVRSAKGFLNLSANLDQARADTIAMELQLVQTSDVAKQAVSNIVDQSGRLQAQLASGILTSDFAKLLRLSLQDLANSGLFEEFSEALGKELTEVLNILVNDFDNLGEFMVDLVPSIQAFAKATAVSAKTLDTFLKVINALPDPVVQFAFQIAILNKLFGNSIANTLKYIAAVKAEVAVTNAETTALGRNTAALAANAAAKSRASKQTSLSAFTGAGVAGAVARTGGRFAIGRIVGSALGGPVGIGLTVAALIPLVYELTRSSSSASDTIKTLEERVRNAGDGFDEATQKVLGYDESLKKIETKSALLSSVELGDNKVQETFVVDVTGKKKQEVDDIRALAQEQGKQILSLNEAVTKGIISLDNERLQAFINGRQTELAVTEQAEEKKYRLIAQGETSTEQFLRKGAVNIFNFVVGTFVKIGQVVGAAIFGVAGTLIGLFGLIADSIGEIPVLLLKVVDSAMSIAIDGLNTVISTANKIPGISIGKIDKLDLSGKVDKSLERATDVYFKNADEAFALAKDLMSDETFQKAIEKIGGFAKILENGSASQQDLDLATQQLLIVMNQATNAINGLIDPLTTLLDNLDDFGAIGRRLQDVSYEMVDGIRVTTGTFYELQSTGFKLSSALSQFEDFFLLKNSLTVLGEITSVFTSLGQAIPTQFDAILKELQVELLASATGIAGLFGELDKMSADSFIEILAKAMESPRFEQNNNIVVRISSTDGTENAAELADNVVRELRNRGATV